MALRYIDLFAGCGGISLGLFNSEKWKGIFAIEKSAFAFSTLKFNLIDLHQHFEWPKWLEVKNHDINDILDSKIDNLNKFRDEVDLIVGGPPCQGFSLAGKRNEDDIRNQLFESYLKFIEIINPKALLFENVKGFDMGFKKEQNGTKGKAYSRILIDRLKSLGYENADYRLLNFKNYGVPQSRERVIVVASKQFSANTFFNTLENQRLSFLREKGLSDNVSINEAISDLHQENGIIDSPDMKRFKAGVYGVETSHFQKLMKENCAILFPDSHRFANHTPKVKEKFRTIIKEKLTSVEVRERFNTKKSRTKLLEAEKPSQTLTTLPDDYVHYSEPRILTVREYARIQSFNDWYQIKGKYTTGGELRKKQVPRYSQIGNAVPPLFAELVGTVLYDLLNNG